MDFPLCFQILRGKGSRDFFQARKLFFFCQMACNYLLDSHGSTRSVDFDITYLYPIIVTPYLRHENSIFQKISHFKQIHTLLHYIYYIRTLYHYFITLPFLTSLRTSLLFFPPFFLPFPAFLAGLGLGNSPTGSSATSSLSAIS